jgi:hypothetical protein
MVLRDMMERDVMRRVFSDNRFLPGFCRITDHAARSTTHDPRITEACPPPPQFH